MANTEGRDVERLRNEWAEAWRQESDAEVAGWAEKHGEVLLAVVEAAKEVCSEWGEVPGSDAYWDALYAALARLRQD